MKKTLNMATRESPLALWQAQFVRSQLIKHHPQLEVQLLGMSTSADRKPYLSLQQMGGKGLFVKELEEALFDGRADLAVHSMKDVPMWLPEGLTLSAFCARENPLDALVTNDYSSLAQLPHGARIGTSSLRRITQLLHLRPDLNIAPIRGNVNTRLKRLDEGEYDGLILAAAGLIRLNLSSRITEYIPAEILLPSPGQGILGIECREQDVKLHDLLQALNHLPTAQCLTAERAMCQTLGGGCQVPIGGFAQFLADGTIQLRGLVANEDGTQILRASYSGEAVAAEEIGKRVAEDLIEQGADKILQDMADRHV